MFSLLFAHKIEGQLLGQQTTVNYEKVEINTPMDDNIFKLPTMETTIKK
jgi:outer membrane lipoprotein-sorting protein